MAENKTKPTEASVGEYLASRGSELQQADCRRLMTLLERATGEPPRMWGPSIVGCGSYRYTYESGRTGEAPLVGFAIRGREIVIYLATDDEKQRSLLSRLGKHRLGKVCVYFRRLSDLDETVLAQLVTNSVSEVKRRYGQP